jgi:hypothetical protein
VTATPTTRAGGVLAATCLSTLVVNANTSAVSILLPAISKDLDAPVAQLQWAVTGYSLVGAAVIVTSGALGDVMGRRKVFLGGLILFVASCVLIALVQSGGGVVAGRMIQGAAGATILACGMSLLSVRLGRGASRSTGAPRRFMPPLDPGGRSSSVNRLAGTVLDRCRGGCGVHRHHGPNGESRDPNRPRSIDYAERFWSLTLAPLILALSQGSTWG